MCAGVLCSRNLRCFLCFSSVAMEPVSGIADCTKGLCDRMTPSAGVDILIYFAATAYWPLTVVVRIHTGR